MITPNTQNEDKTSINLNPPSNIIPKGVCSSKLMDSSSDGIYLTKCLCWKWIGDVVAEMIELKFQFMEGPFRGKIISIEASSRGDFLSKEGYGYSITEIASKLLKRKLIRGESKFNLDEFIGIDCKMEVVVYENIIYFQEIISI